MTDGVTTPLPLLLDGLRSGALDLLAYVDELAAQFARREPDVLAFVPENGRFARLRHDARALLARYPDPAARPPLFGLVIGVKDIFHVAGFETRAGSRLPVERLQGAEAASVTRLRQAGALLLGKTVTTEFAYFAPGPTRNPVHPAHTPGGSSSGSAAAVGADLCPVALGTQTIGSINRPAAFCGVVGYKPSYDRISRAGVIPLSDSLDHVGLFARQVAGAERVAAQLCAGWRGAAAAERAAAAGRMPVLGIPDGAYLQHASAEAAAQFEAACRRLAAAGCRLVPVEALPDYAAIRARHVLLMAAEAAAFHAGWFAEFGERYHPKTAALLRQGQQAAPAAVAAARAGRLDLRQRLLDLMAAHGLDAWISPAATGPAPRGLTSTGDPVMNLPWTHAGLPTLSIPAGSSADGLPLGVQLVGRFGEDEALFQVGRLVENEVSRLQ